MVMRIKNKAQILLITFLLALTFQSGKASYSKVDSAVLYHIDQEWVTVWINEDASLDIHYNITITYETNALGYITVGLPVRGFKILSVMDINSTVLSYEDVSRGDYYAVEVYLGHPMNPGDSGTVLIMATVADMVSPDELNPGYVGVNFKPTYFDADVKNLRVAIVPPKGVTEDSVKTSKTAYFTTVDGDFALYWENYDLPPNTQLSFGVSVPEEYITVTSTGFDGWYYIIIISASVAIIGIIAVIVYLVRSREVYVKPKIGVEALGPARGLTAVEAGVVIGLSPVRVLTMILFGLLLKGFIFIQNSEPILRVEKLVGSFDETDSHPRYYEIDFLKVIKTDGSLSERRLAQTYVSLRDMVDTKLKGYARQDTVNYYKSIVDKAWSQVKEANTPQLAEDAIEKNLQWILLEDDYGEKLKKTITPNIIFLPRPDRYWYGPRFPTTIDKPVTSTEAKPIPTQEFADKVVSGIEQATAGLVKNAEDFTSRLIPSKTTSQSSKPIHRKARCVCACASCACACACVSCACACAGGGAR